MGQDRPSSGAQPLHRSGDALEWIIAAFSSVIVAGMIGFLLLESVASSDASAEPVAVVTRIAPLDTGFRVDIRATNKGGTTAAAVRFRATLLRDGQTIEAVEVTFDFLPAQSSREGAVIFANDPRLHDVVIQAESYTDP